LVRHPVANFFHIPCPESVTADFAALCASQMRNIARRITPDEIEEAAQYCASQPSPEVRSEGPGPLTDAAYPCPPRGFPHRLPPAENAGSPKESQRHHDFLDGPYQRIDDTIVQ